MYTAPTQEQMHSMKFREIEADNKTWIIGRTLVGTRVKKNSGRPFKSGNKVNIVKDVVRNPNTNLWAVSFFEDDSAVDVKQVRFAGAE